MLHLEYNDKSHLIPPVGLTMVELDPNKNKLTRFKWPHAIGNKIKKDVVVFKHGKVEDFCGGKRQLTMSWRNRRLKTPLISLLHSTGY